MVEERAVMASGSRVRVCWLSGRGFLVVCYRGGQGWGQRCDWRWAGLEGQVLLSGR
jgi:hypothetical protein